MEFREFDHKKHMITQIVFVAIIVAYQLTLDMEVLIVLFMLYWAIYMLIYSKSVDIQQNTELYPEADQL